MSKEFHRIYWSGQFNWKDYARYYNDYIKTEGNYYTLSAEALINSVEIKNDFVVVDLACGTGALTKVLLEKYPKTKIIAIDISEDSLEHYKENFKEQIENKQIKVFQGNAEKISDYVKEEIDLIFIASALWDLELEALFKNIPIIMKEDAKIVTNLPSLTIGEEKGFIFEIEEFFKNKQGIKKFYRRIKIEELKALLTKKHLKIAEKIKYQFLMPKKSVKQFFDFLKYRYPFIFFSDEIPYKERFQKCEEGFNELLKASPNEGMEEQGYVIVIAKHSESF